MAEVGLRVVVGQAEHDEQALPEVVGPLHRVLQRVVVLRPLGGLYPVQDIIAIPDILGIEMLDPLFLHALGGPHRTPPSTSLNGKHTTPAP